MSLLSLCPSVLADPSPVAYVDLKQQLMRKGLDKNYVSQVFADSRNSFLPDVVRKIAYLRKETRDIYAKFLTPQVAARGRAYMQEHRSELNRAATRYGVAPEVIVAILTVESDLGNATGRHPVFNVFASLAVMDTPEVIRELGLDPSLQARLHKKAAWAQRELLVFLEYCRAKRLDPFFYKGSWAGAMGFCQFLPTSLKNCGADGDGDGRVDLFTHADAISSIACYLHQSGFKQQNRSTWRRAVHRYNHSEAYVDTVLHLANSY
ncbi:MAG: lytic murein transglycosylase [Deltaproteobacteria bacterium]|nr:lytic murein transglycosylase [Deltaproteobacteria bacterium]